MCGIVGTIQTPLSGGQEQEVVRAMANALRHRGPDDDGFYFDTIAQMGMRRLAIMDVSHGQQPVFSEDKSIVAVFNGEIYNFRELRSRLRQQGHQFSSSGDSEVLVHLYEEHGLDFVHHLRGMFAIALWDTKERKLVLVRDRLGKKPLFYAQFGEGLAFASEMKSLRAVPTLPFRLDPVSLDLYLTYQYVPAPRTIYREIRRILPGGMLVWSRGRIQQIQYWETPTPTAQLNVNRHDAQEQIRSRILQATAIRLESERPLGVFLSGGLDSSTVVAAAARVSSQRLKTFSVGFGDDTGINELPFSRLVAQRYDTEHHEIVVEPHVLRLLPTIIRQFDEPFADPSAVPSWMIAQEASKQVTVVLNGDGGDEVFGGYGRYLRLRHRLPRAFLPITVSMASAHLARMAEAKASESPRYGALSNAARTMSSPNPADRYARMISSFAPEDKRRLYRPEYVELMKNTDPYALVRREWWNGRGNPVRRAMRVDARTYLPGALLPKVDMTTMAMSLEARSPLLDHKLMEYAAGLPDHWLVNRGSNKIILKEAVAPWLPRAILSRPKAGFGIPLRTWLQTELWDTLNDALLDENSLVGQFIDLRELRILLEDERWRVGWANMLWSLLVLELWSKNSE